MITEELRKEIVQCAQQNNIGSYHWGNYLPKGSIVHKQLDDNTHGMQLYIRERDGYPAYAKVKNELCTLFSKYNLCCAEEIDLGATSGWHKELHFIEKSAMQAVEVVTQEAPMTSIGTQIIGNVTVNDGNVVTGNENVVRTEVKRASSPPADSHKGWFKKEIAKWLLGILSALIIAFLVYKLGWSQ